MGSKRTTAQGGTNPKRRCTDSLPNFDFSKLYELREDPKYGKTCDVVILVQGNRFPCHKVVLVHASPVFAAILTGPMKESSQSEVTLQEVSVETFSHVLKYVHTGDSDFITLENTVDVLDAASRFQLEHLMIAAAEGIRTNLDAMDFLNFTHKYNVAATKENSKQQILSSFLNYKCLSKSWTLSSYHCW